MTSKSLFFKLLKEDFKIRIWTFAISILTFFFGIIVATAMIISRYSYYAGEFLTAQDIERNKLDLIDTFRDFFAPGNAMFSIVFLLLSILMAMSGFAYLYSKKKVDFYHSLPVKRETLFFVKVVNSVITVLIPYIISIFISLLVIWANVGRPVLILEALGDILIWSLLFFLNYMVAVLAVMLTGNMLIGMLACGFFYFYFPLLSQVLQEYYRISFSTYYKLGFIIEDLLLNLSSLIIIFNPYAVGKAMTVICSLIISIVMIFINLFLYKKRASETAGKSIAFDIIKSPVKFMTVIIISMLMYILAYQVMDMDYDRAISYWGIFGAVVSGVLTHSIMEIIYNQDFKKIFAKKIEMGASIAIALFIIAIFRFDLFGYDRYIPKIDSIKSVSVRSDLLESNEGQYYYQMKIWEDEGIAYNADVEYRSSLDMEDDLFKKMNIENKEAVLELAKLCIDNEDTMVEGQRKNIVVSYKLNSGKVVQRQYYIDYNTVAKQLASIYNGENFKQASYPIFGQKAEDFVSLDFDGVGKYDSHIVLNDESLRNQLLEAYKKELGNFKYEDRAKSYQFASIRFNDAYMQRALDIYLRDKTGGYMDGIKRFTDVEYVNAMNDVGYYPLYPEFKETIAILEKLGVNIVERMPAEDVDKVEVSHNEWQSVEGTENTEDGEGYYQTVTTTFNDPEDISMILEKLNFTDTAYKDEINEDMDVSVEVYLKETVYNGDGSYYRGSQIYYDGYPFHFRPGDLPKNLAYTKLKSQ